LKAEPVKILINFLSVRLASEKVDTIFFIFPINYLFFVVTLIIKKLTTFYASNIILFSGNQNSILNYQKLKPNEIKFSY